MFAFKCLCFPPKIRMKFVGEFRSPLTPKGWIDNQGGGRFLGVKKGALTMREKQQKGASFASADIGRSQKKPEASLCKLPRFLSAVKPTDQGEESVVLHVVVAGGTVFKLPMYSFLGCEKAKTLHQNGCL